MSRTHRLLSALLGGALILAACGSDSDEDAAADTDAEAPAGEATGDAAAEGDCAPLESMENVTLGTSSTLSIGTTIQRSEEHTSALQSLMRTSSAVFCLTTKTLPHKHINQL